MSWRAERPLAPSTPKRHTQRHITRLRRSRMMAGGGASGQQVSEEQQTQRAREASTETEQKTVSSTIQNVAESPIAAAGAEASAEGLMLPFLLVPSQRSETSIKCRDDHGA